MRYAIVADIHANLAAFRAVLDDLEHRGGADELWCLGDTVGYGPDPQACLELLQKQQHCCVAGNHDWAVVEKVDTANLNPLAATAARWTAARLNAEEKEYLANLPSAVEKGDFTLVHGSPREPIWEYVNSASIARENLHLFPTRFCLVGHTHVPMIFKEEGDDCTGSRFQPEIKLVLGESRLIINPGGVGQPRDGDPRASYAIYDTDPGVIRIFRIPYDIEATQTRMLQAGLPIHLVTRLNLGV